MKKGFTLVELVIYIAITSMMLLGIVNFLYLTISSRVKNQVVSEVEEQGRVAMQSIVANIRDADSITSPATGVSASSLTLASYDAGNNPIVYSLSGTKLQIKLGAAANVDLISDKVEITALSFHNVSRASTAGAVKVQFTINYYNPGATQLYTYSKIFYGTASLR